MPPKGSLKSQMPTRKSAVKSPQKERPTSAAAKREEPAVDPAPPVGSSGATMEYLKQAAGFSHTEEMLRAFDLTSKYGPCTGVTRLERWERAERLGLSPPAEIRDLLVRLGGEGSEANNNIWYNRV